LVKYLRM